jgi:hypothetical protein
MDLVLVLPTHPHCTLDRTIDRRVGIDQVQLSSGTGGENDYSEIDFINAPMHSNPLILAAASLLKLSTIS